MRYTLQDFFEKVIPDAPPTAFLKIALEEVLIKCLSANFLAYREWEAILGWYRYNLTYNEIAAAWGGDPENAHTRSYSVRNVVYDSARHMCWERRSGRQPRTIGCTVTSISPARSGTFWKS